MTEPQPFVDDDGDVAPPGPGRVVPSGPKTTGPVDMSTSYLGMTLRSPVVASASPMTGDLRALPMLVQAGVGAVVLPSLFEEQIDQEADQLAAYVFADAADAEASTGYTPGLLDSYNNGAQRYLQFVRETVGQCGVPVIPSLNGVTRGGWVTYATKLADAGAAAIELNVYRIAAEPELSGRDIEDETLSLIEAVVAATEVPVAVKLGPYFSAFAHFAHRIADAGAAGVVVFNRFYQPDIDLTTLSVEPKLVLSTSDEMRLPLRWCAILSGRTPLSLALTTGVHTVDDVVKALLAGAHVAMTTSALLKHGPGHVHVLHSGVERWLAEHGYGSVSDAVGAVSYRNVADPAQYERANYLGTLTRIASRYH
ncbi:MAG: dihydroorotate dehydrogenase-like protein [Nitriliruptoraceae bacterium]